SEVQELVEDFTRKSLPPKIVDMLANAGNMNLAVQFKGTPSLFRVNMGAETEVGGVNFDLALQPHRDRLRSGDGNVAARNLHLGELLGRPDLFGDASLSARIDGVIGRGYADAQVDGTVEQLTFNDYTYDTLRLDGRLFNKRFDGRISARDPHLDFDFSGLLDFNERMPRYDFLLALHRADLAQLRSNRRDSVSQLAARVVARGSGRSLDDMNGIVQVSDVVYRYNDKTLEVDSLAIRGKNSATSKLIELRSDFADATFRSKTSYREVFAYLRQSAGKYLPQLGGRRKGHDEKKLIEPVSDNYSQLKVDIRNFDPVIDAVSPGLQIAEGSSLNLTFNPANDRLSFRAVSDYIERGSLLAIRLNVNARNTNDSLVVSADAENFYAAGLHLPGLQISGGAKGGQVELSTGFTDTTRHFSGLFGIRAGMLDEDGPNGSVLDVRILPSRIVRGNATWRILSRGIRIDTAQVVIDRFLVTSNGQHLLLDGVASRNPNDSLSLRLSNFDLAPFSQIVDRMGYGIEGRTNGEATMKAVLGGGEISADIRLDSLSVNGFAGPSLQLTSRWELARNRAGVFVTNRMTRDTLVRGFYAPKHRRYYARMRLDSIDMGLIDPILSGVVSSTEGMASADLVLRGERRDADLTGSIKVRGLRTTVDFTQVTYDVPDVSLDVRGNQFSCSNVPIFDSERNRGLFDLKLNLQHLSNIGYDVWVRPERMLVLDTDESDNDVFYGKVYATGNARISGDKGKVDMRISAATDDNSSFFLPMSSKSNISNADFVVFAKPQLEDTTDLLVLKRQQFERRRKRRSGTVSQMNISMTLDVRPNVDLELSVSGNVIRARGTGTLSMQINPKSNVFEMYGDYTIDDGSFHFTLQNILNRRFEIEPGSTIQWTGSPINAMLNIDALYKVKASLQPLLGSTSDRMAGDRSVNVECLIHLGERLTDPTVTFDVRVPATDPETQAIIANALNTPETVDMQFLYLLLFKSFMAENNVASQNIGASVSYNTGLEFLTNQLSNLLSADDY
ncbi:MAG: translocation/assembly module TamB, partial [Alistipes sp.]|nr:translocation/assembly module TamB [Alistipes sp.]